MTALVYRVRLVCAAAVCLVTSSLTVTAQENRWQVDAAPLYVWAATTNGNIAINGTANIPVYLSFADAASKPTAAFMFHGSR